MKNLLIALVVTFLASVSFGQNLVNSPTSSADNTVTSSDPSVVGITLETEYDGIDSIANSGFGGYFSSMSSVGIYSQSYSGNSAVFSSGTSTNSAPTVVIQGVGGSADLLQIQDALNAKLASIDSSGLIKASSGLELPNSGTCDSAHRRDMKVLEGGTGVADKLQVCLKAANGTFSWVTK